MSSAAAVRLPTIHELGAALLVVSQWQLAVTLARPLGCFAAYWVFAALGWWPLAVLAVAGLQFFTYTSTSHDLAHRTLRLPRWLNEILLALCEVIALRSGHAFRITHLHHHRRFPAEDDVEAAGATGSLWRALLAGPGHQPRLFLWAWRHARGVERRWLIGEAAGVLAFVVAAVALWPVWPVAGIYVALVATSSWIYPTATVWWPHHAEGTTALTQTRAFRGTWIPRLFFQHTYHLEHHLYPMVPACHWRTLAQRLDPHLRAAGVTPVQLL